MEGPQTRSGAVAIGASVIAEEIPVAILIVLSFALVIVASEDVRTRAEVLAASTDPGLRPERRYGELDLNGDGTNDLVVSESISLGGTGGLVYNLYLGLGQDRYRQIDCFLAGTMALEEYAGTRRLWSYTHSSATSGTIQYRYFDRKGVFQKSEALTIHPGDGGSEIGNAVYQAIFNEKTKLDLKKTGGPNESTTGKAGVRVDVIPPTIDASRCPEK